MQRSAIVKYHCPYCKVLIEHRPKLAGDRVICSKCRGAYYEPTDPLPGILPEKAPAEEDEEEVKTSGEESIDFAPVDDDANSLQQADAKAMVSEISRRGQHAVMVSWPRDRPREANMTFSESLSREQANDMILQIAMHLMKSKWPDLHQMAEARIKANKPMA